MKVAYVLPYMASLIAKKKANKLYYYVVESGRVEGKPRTRENSKQAAVIQMLQRPEGATINQICAATGWQAHTVRGAFAGALKKKRGLTVTSEKLDGGERVYRLCEASHKAEFRPATIVLNSSAKNGSSTKKHFACLQTA